MEETGTRITVSSIGEITTFNQERVITIAAGPGEADAVSRAEAIVSAKLRAAYESDVQAMTPQTVMFPGLHPAAMMSTPAAATGLAMPHAQATPPHHHQQHHQQHHQALPMNGGGRMPPPHHHQPQQQFGNLNQPPHFQFHQLPGGGGFHMGQQQQHHYQQQQQQHQHHQAALAASAATATAGSSNAVETVNLYVPNGVVGALIGSKGGHIRNIIKFSGASVKIAQTEEQRREQERKRREQENQADGEEGGQATNPDDAPAAADATTAPSTGTTSPDERKVTITGNPEAQWKAQYLVFEKLREEGFFSKSSPASSSSPQSSSDPAQPPSSSPTGEVRLTAEILVPASQVGRIIGKGGANVREMQRVTGAAIKLPEQGTVEGEETPVHITGTFYSVQVRLQKKSTVHSVICIVNILQSAQRRLRAMIQTASQQQERQQSKASVSQQQPSNGGGDSSSSSSPEAAKTEEEEGESNVVRLEEASEC